MTPTIVHEDNHLLLVNKPAGMLVQGDATGDACLKDWAEIDVAQRHHKPGKAFIGVTHRLDRPTSGLVLLTRTSKALSRMSQAFASRQVDKTYWAIVEGHPEQPQGRLTDTLLRDPKKNKSFVSKRPQAKQAILNYQVIQSLDNYSLLEIQLETGRHHQIRCQLAHMGHAIVGDVKYGARRGLGDGSIGLHARSLSFTHPTTKESMAFTAELPDCGMWGIVNP